MSFNGKLIIVRACPGGKDVIYIGYAHREGDMLLLTQANNILRYTEVGVSGVASQPTYATRLRPATGPDGRVWIPLISVSDILEADPSAWTGLLRLSR